MAQTVLWFAETNKEDLPAVGGKAANLGELTRIGLPIPNGFTIVTAAYFDFLKTSGLEEKINKISKNFDTANTKLLEDTSELIKKAVLAHPIQKDLTQAITESYRRLSQGNSGLVAVRSSATAEDLPGASFAGQQATFLNIKGERQLLEAVKRCWASLYTPRAIFYRKEKGFDRLKVGMAVVVQEMVPSEVSGVMFTIDPVENDKNKIIVEAIWGLGELIVQGAVSPDHYEVAKSSFKIINKQVAQQTKELIKVGKETREITVAAAYQAIQKLADEKIIELARIGKKIENHYGFPQDIEWALSDGQISIVQTRAVTTIGEVDKELKKHIQIDLPVILKGSPASPGIAIGLPQILLSAKEIDKIHTGDILVAAMTSPDYVPAMKKAVGIVTDKGGRTSHAAIVSRELGIPCVVGAKNGTKTLAHKNTIITVDGTAGLVYNGALSPQKLNAIEYTQKVKEEQTRPLKTATKVFVNLGEQGLAQEVAKRYVDGVGLLRAEFIIAGIGTHPRSIIAEHKQKSFIEKLTKGLETFASAFDPRPVIYRATDFKSNEYKNLKGGAKYEEDEPNPLLGFRGACRYISDPAVFEMELTAIKNVRNKLGFRNLWLMIPFVRTIDEMEQVKKLVSATGLHRGSSFKLLMMAELPSNVLLIDQFLDTGIDGISIGSNDLTMLLLGVDRDNAKVATEFNELDPAVLQSMERLIRETRKRKLYSGICGQAPSLYPELTEKLVGWGISSISVSPDAIEKTRQIVYEAERKLVAKS